MRNKAMTKMLAATAATSALLTANDGNAPYYGIGEYLDSIPKGSTQRDYKNKNANVEYYTDEKGNIRRRKIKK